MCAANNDFSAGKTYPEPPIRFISSAGKSEIDGFVCPMKTTHVLYPIEVLDLQKPNLRQIKEFAGTICGVKLGIEANNAWRNRNPAGRLKNLKIRVWQRFEFLEFGESDAEQQSFF